MAENRQQRYDGMMDAFILCVDRDGSHWDGGKGLTRLESGMFGNNRILPGRECLGKR